MSGKRRIKAWTFRALHVFIVVLFIIISLSGVLCVRVKSGKTTPTSDTMADSSTKSSLSSSTPKLEINPSQQIVIDLLTPQQTKKRSSRHRERRKKSNKLTTVNANPNAPTPGWTLEYPRVPVLQNFSTPPASGGPFQWESVKPESNSQTQTQSDDTNNNYYDLQNSGFSSSNSWVGLRKTQSSTTAPDLHPVTVNSVEGAQDSLRKVLPESRLPYNSVNRIGMYSNDDDDEDDEDDDDGSRSEEKKEKVQKKKKGNSNSKGKKSDISSTYRDNKTDSKIKTLEETVVSLTKNVEVMRQNTQVISKGFNILSTRFNKLSADHDELNLKLDKKFVLIEESLIRMQKEIGKKVKELIAKTQSDTEKLRKADQELTATQSSNHQEHKKWTDNVVQKMTSWKADADNESKVIAEMVKALAEIQKKEKAKLEKIAAESDQTIKKLKLKVESLESKTSSPRPSSSFRDALEDLDDSTKEKVVEIERSLEDVNQSLKNESDSLKSELVAISKYVEDQFKRVDETLQEGNTAHNMAHEHIALKIKYMEEKVDMMRSHSDKSGYKDSGEERDRFKMLEEIRSNLTLLSSDHYSLEKKVESMEDTDLSILSRVADLRNTQLHETETTKVELKRLTDDVKQTREDLSNRIPTTRKRSDLLRNEALFEIGGLSMDDQTTTLHTLKPQDVHDQIDIDTDIGVSHSVFQEDKLDKGEMRDRVSTLEENISELWRSQKEFRRDNDYVKTLVREMKKSDSDSTQQIIGITKATNTLTEAMKNSTLKLSQVERHVKVLQEKMNELEEESSEKKEEEILGRRNLHSTSEISLVRDEMHNLRETVELVLKSNKNVTKAQEFFLLKLLEMDQEHKKDNSTFSIDINSIRNQTEETLQEISRAEERLSKVVQQFQITDAEQMKIREELLNIKDRLASLEESYVNMWKSKRKFIGELEQVMNNVDNINVVHGSELQSVSAELNANKAKIDNFTRSWKSLENRLFSVEMLMDVDTGNNDSSTSELSKLKSKISATEKDIAELWKSSEILSFQQQVIAENLKFMESTHENDTTSAAGQRKEIQEGTSSLLEQFKNLTRKMTLIDRCTNPPYETKSITYEIPDWYATSASGSLKEYSVEYHIGKLIGHKSLWKAFMDINGTHLSLYNSLVSSDGPLYNELEVQILDSDGRVFSSFGPEQHLYGRKGDKIGWSDVIPLSTLENPKNNLLSRNVLRMKLKVRVYPWFEKEKEAGVVPSEKQLVQMEIKNLHRKLKLLKDKESSDELFNELNVTKEFAAGHTFGGVSLWRVSLLMKTINKQEYLGISMELGQTDGEWKELLASYNVTLLDAHSRIAKEFSISPNDFVAVSARHSYFILVSDLEDILKKGDALTMKIYFDLQGKRKSYEVEVIR